jgi:NAD-dependent SIR2 family protein deacetylase
MASKTNTSRAADASVQFVKGGPRIPLKLLQSLEDGQLVVFCGAGISRRCGLPDFKGLVDPLCQRLGKRLEDDEQEIYDNGSYDLVLGLIESRIRKGSLRDAVRAALTIPPGSDLGTHEALLQLATSKAGRIRLVTTNFDDAFELAQYSGTRSFDYAPYLPISGESWSSVVHLHGGLQNRRDTDSSSLVLTSADFGRAYIAEGVMSRK